MRKFSTFAVAAALLAFAPAAPAGAQIVPGEAPGVRQGDVVVPGLKRRKPAVKARQRHGLAPPHRFRKRAAGVGAPRPVATKAAAPAAAGAGAGAAGVATAGAGATGGGVTAGGTPATGGTAKAGTPAAPKAAVTPKEQPKSGSRGIETLAQCMAYWDKGTHMTKAEWRAVCVRQIRAAAKAAKESPLLSPVEGVKKVVPKGKVRSTP